MTRPPVDARIVKERAAGKWLSVLATLAPALENAAKHPGRHVPCPVHGGEDGFRLFRDANSTGGGICNTCGARSDGLALLQWVNDWSFPETVAAVAEHLGVVSGTGGKPARGRRPGPAPTEGDKSRHERRALHALDGVWSKGVPLSTEAGAPGLRYLRSRGIELTPDPSRVRCHPALGYYELRNGRLERLGTYPALLARYTDARDRMITIQRTYLTAEGCKAPVRWPKKAMRSAAGMAGGCVRLSPAAWEVGIAEGVETALAVQQRAEMPVWATLSATLLETWEPPPQIRLVVIWADRDRNGRGQDAARTLQARLEARGIVVDCNLPDGPVPDGWKSVDWADSLRPRRSRS